MSNIKITQLIKYKENFNFEHDIKGAVFSHKNALHKSLFKSESTQSYSIEI